MLIKTAGSRPGIYARYMSQELALTAINRTSFSFNSVRSDFEVWLKDAGASQTTVRSYGAAIQKWLKILALSPGVRPAVVWQRSQLSASIKRVIGYACRRYSTFSFGSTRRQNRSRYSISPPGRQQTES